MRTIARWTLRIFLLSIAAAMVIASVDFSVGSGPPREIQLRTYRRRPLSPQPRRIPQFGGQVLLLGLGAVAGRKILRLRL